MNRKLKDVILVAIMLVTGFWWVLSFASLLTATLPMTILCFVTSFIMAWFCLANFVNWGER